MGEGALQLPELGAKTRVTGLRLLLDALEAPLDVIAVGNEKLEPQRLQVVCGITGTRPVVQNGEQSINLAQVAEKLSARSWNVDHADRGGSHLLRLHDLGQLGQA